MSLLKEHRLHVDESNQDDSSTILFTESSAYSTPSLNGEATKTSSLAREKCIEWLFEDICKDVISSEYETPSVPHAIFEVINEF